MWPRFVRTRRPGAPPGDDCGCCLLAVDAERWATDVAGTREPLSPSCVAGARGCRWSGSALFSPTLAMSPLTVNRGSMTLGSGNIGRVQWCAHFGIGVCLLPNQREVDTDKAVSPGKQKKAVAVKDHQPRPARGRRQRCPSWEVFRCFAAKTPSTANNALSGSRQTTRDARPYDVGRF